MAATRGAMFWLNEQLSERLSSPRRFSMSTTLFNKTALVVSVLLLLLLPTARADDKCFRNICVCCSCNLPVGDSSDTIRWMVKCSGLNFQSVSRLTKSAVIPANEYGDLFIHSVQLDLSYNDIQRLPVHFIADRELQVENLNISYNKLHSIEKLAFNDTSIVGYLDLSANLLESLVSNTFRSLYKLSELYLQNNQLTYLQEGVFDGLAKLEVLNLSTNQLQAISKDVFSDLFSLRNLDLSNNFLSSAPMLDAQRELMILNLANNLICEIEPNMFQNNMALRFLYLADNCLTAIAPSTFAGLNNLWAIDLSQNRIRNIKDGSLDFLSMDLSNVFLRQNCLAVLQEKVFSQLFPELHQSFDFSYNLIDLSAKANQWLLRSGRYVREPQRTDDDWSRCASQPKSSNFSFAPLTPTGFASTYRSSRVMLTNDLLRSDSDAHRLRSLASNLLFSLCLLVLCQRM